MQSDKAELYLKEIEDEMIIRHLGSNPYSETIVMYKDGTRKSFMLTEEEQRELFFKLHPECFKKENEFSSSDEFFSKEIKNVDYGDCQESYPCQHPKITVTYVDGEIKYFNLNGLEVVKLCEKHDREIPNHFFEIEDFRRHINRLYR